MNKVHILIDSDDMPPNEGEGATHFLGGSSMGNWFENMEKMDIQAERRNTQEAKEQLAKAEEALNNTKSELSDTKSELSHKEAELNKKETQLISTIIQMTREYSGTKEQAIAKIIDTCGKTEVEAKELVEKYW